MKGLLVGLLCLLILPAADCFGQYVASSDLWLAVPGQFDFSGSGARAQGMGKAFLAVSDDISAITWNPAGLYQKDTPFETPVLGLGYRKYTGDAVFTISDVTIINPQRYPDDDAFGSWGMAGFLAPLRIKGHPFVMSGNYYSLGDEYRNEGGLLETETYYTTNDSANNILHPLTVSSYGEYHSAVDAFSFGFGTRLYDKMSMGVAVNAYFGSGVNNFDYKLTMDGYSPEAVYPQRVVRVADSLSIDSISYSGMYFTFGLKYAAERLALGLVVRTPHKLVQTTDNVMILTIVDNDRLNGDPIKRHRDDRVVELEQPLTIAGGLAFHLTPKWLWAMDAEYRGYEGLEVRVRDSILLISGEKDQEFFSSVDFNWNNILSVRTGTEYLIETGSRLFPIVPVRMGFAYVPITSPSVNTTLQTETATRTEWSFGAGARWGQVHLDAALTFTDLTRENHEAYNVVTEYGVYHYEQSSEIENSDKLFSVTFTGFF